MMQCFVIQAQDGTDAAAFARRQAARPAHLANLDKSLGFVKMAVATLDANGQPNGSVVIAEFADRAALDAWLASEPYVTEKVWQTVTVTPCRLPPAFATPS